ncbi:MAG: putative lipopolysaccharide heptosyltransferase III [Verrucomicrobiae bacterium]|nr:putative lipopolysaccharide heptosyltransferase III [Verrucomicrobiae bacterium]
MNILLIKLRHHGDVLLTTPVARALKEKFSTSQIDLLVYEGTEPLVKNNPDFRHIWSWNRDLRGRKSILSHLRVFFQMRRQRYDWVLHLSDQMQGALMAKLLARQGSIGIDYPRRQDIFWKSCFTHLVPLFSSNTHHTVEQNLAVLAPLGIKPAGDETCCRLEIADDDRSVVQKYLQQHHIEKPYLVVHPAARWVFKCWEDDRFAEVIQHFATQGWPIILTSSPEKEEVALVDAILKKVTAPQIISLAGQLTLGELAALIEGSRLFLGVDSVPMHMAAALKKDTVALFGPSKVNEWHPWQTRYRLIDARDYGSLLDPDAVNTATQERYLKNIPVAPVVQAVEELLHS